ncbi:hypothetical protein EU811_22580 [Arthrobacter sp. TS-15]|uniref:hypothetical protein n=1 Tax=Arthrobacter sp. TS-15 TaxID=2510797 RepID=UPI00115E5ECA|nr:hypothetical protein [Arthrobacter sp. TS-15]TQS87368.1 hypothetical protein EU811_22580 [Arthrobacter sp. TS-15]
MKSTIDLSILITATNRANMEKQLDEAVAVARTAAIYEGCRGILITRHSIDSFTVALSDGVPYGLTRELQEWQPKAPVVHQQPQDC